MDIQEHNDERIYRAYRLTLKSQPRGASTRAAARKQKSREIVAERYKLPISRVKQIVREFDAIHGITHDQNPAEVFTRACHEAIAAAQAWLEEFPEPKRCTYCAESESDELPIRDRFDEIAGRGRNVSVRLNRIAYGKGIAEARVICDACNLAINTPELMDSEMVINSAHYSEIDGIED